MRGMRRGSGMYGTNGVDGVDGADGVDGVDGVDGAAVGGGGWRSGGKPPQSKGAARLARERPEAE